MRITTLILALAIACAASWSVASAAGPGGAGDPQVRTPSLECAATDQGPHFAHYPALKRKLVPGKPDEALLCRYSPNDHSLIGSALLLSRGTQRVAGLFNGLQAPPIGVIACPINLGGTVIAHFRFSERPDELVTQELSGCRFADNGEIRSWAAAAPGPKLLHLLKVLTGAGAN